MRSRKWKILRFVALLFLIGMYIAVSGQPVLADPHTGQSKNVVIIGASSLQTGNTCSGSSNTANNMYYTYGGCLPVGGPAGELGDFTFTAMTPAAVSAASLAPYDTAVLNVASSGMACNTNNLTAQQKTDLINFVGAGKKLIIFDSECSAQNYSWLPFPFTTSNPGAMGAYGTLNIVEENFLSSKILGNVHYIDANHLGKQIDAVGDMNVMTTYNANWCLDMSGTNALNKTGPVHTYAKYPSGTDKGLIIYNGMDQDYQGYGYNDAVLRKVWVQELQQPFNPSNLPCGVTVVGITLSPMSASNNVGTSHTVTARVTDMLNNPQPGVQVTFTVLAGPNAGASGTCTVNANCTTDANGNVSFTYTSNGVLGTDDIQACFTNQAGQQICSQIAHKEWTTLAGVCDVNSDGSVNILDINIIGKFRGQTSVACPACDVDGDGWITTNDARQCVLLCNKPRCAQ